MGATVSVRQLALRLGVDARIIRGIAIGLGIRPLRTRAAGLFTETQAERITRAVEKERTVAVS